MERKIQKEEVCIKKKKKGMIRKNIMDFVIYNSSGMRAFGDDIFALWLMLEIHDRDKIEFYRGGKSVIYDNRKTAKEKIDIIDEIYNLLVSDLPTYKSRHDSSFDRLMKLLGAN